MKKKIRKIVVDKQEYVWAATRYNCDGDGGYMVKIWKDKKLIYEQLTHAESVTPGNIAGFIRCKNSGLRGCRVVSTIVDFD